jgi:NADH-quinone oxidoreductase subunit J
MTETIPALLFYLFATVLVGSAGMVVLSRNPVHSVLFLILAFFNSAGLFLLLGAEFVAFIQVIVYVGAVAVLFLFVVMMLDIDFAELRKGAWKVWPVGLLVGGVLIVQLVVTMLTWQSLPQAKAEILTPSTKIVEKVEGANAIAKLEPGKPVAETPKPRDNTHMLGDVLYTEYVYPFQVAGLILLVAMIGAITLTLRLRSGTLRQNISRQTTRKIKDVLDIRKVEKGSGVS